nr:hypothetical protein [Tanacetum cinerariifolium]
MQQKIERLQAQENAHLKTTYKNLFDSISVSRVQTETKIVSLQNELQSNIYKNAKLRTQLFKKASDYKDNTQDTSKNTKFAKQPIGENFPKVGKTNALSKPVTSNSVSTPQVSKGVNNAKVIAPRMFRISPGKILREAKKVPNTVNVSSRTKSIAVSQPNVITKKNVNSDLNGLSSTGLDNTKTRRPQHRSNTKNDRVPSAFKSSQSKNKEAKVEEHHRNLLLCKNNKHMSSACNNFKLDSQDVISKVVCAVCKKCLISVNHDKCLRIYVNGKIPRGKKQTAKVSVKEIQKNYQPKIAKPKKIGTRESLATPKPSNSRFILRWSPTGKLFDTEGKIVDYSESKSTSDCSNGDNACTSNAMEPKIKRLFQAHDRKFKASHQFHLEVYGNCLLWKFKGHSQRDLPRNTPLDRIEVLVDIEKEAVCSSLRSLKPKCTIESRAKRSSKIISLGHYYIMLTSSHTMKSKSDIKSPTYYPRGIARTSE